MERIYTDRTVVVGRVLGTLAPQHIYDLLLICLLALLSPVLLVLPFPLLRVPLGLALVLIVPGSALTVALFPRPADLDGTTRAALSVGLSAAVVPILALLLNVLPWGIHPWPIAIALAIWTLTWCGVALWRRRALASLDQMPSVDGTLRRSRALKLGGKGIAAAAALLFAVVLLLSVILLPILMPTLHTTEFYILGTEGQAEKYPRQVAPGEPVGGIVGIANQEGGERIYRIEVWAIDTRGGDRRAMVAQVGPIRLTSDQRLERPILWRMPWADDDQEVRILLFIDETREPYRQLRLWLNVGSDPTVR
jgi:uncharacterized membrane protein